MLGWIRPHPPFAPSRIARPTERGEVPLKDRKDEETDADADDSAGRCGHPRLEPEHWRESAGTGTKVGKTLALHPVTQLGSKVMWKGFRCVRCDQKQRGRPNS